MPSVCKFDLDKPDATYRSGETISGTITLTTTSDKHVEDIQIIFLGEANVKWKKHIWVDCDDDCFPYSISYTSHELYFKNSTIVHRRDVLSPGTRTYTFNISLPLESPSSFEGKYGKVYYELSLKLTRYYRADIIYKQPVTVIKTFDLNLHPNYKMPLVSHTCSISGFWPFSRSKILYTLKIPYSAYTPGQCVKYSLSIVNQSEDDTEGYFIEFTKKIIFISKYPSRKKRHLKEVISSRYFPTKCLQHSSRIIEGIYKIPQSCTITQKLSIISVEYFLKVKIRLKRYSSNPELKVPIIIGTIPIRENLIPNQTVLSLQQQEQVLQHSSELAPIVDHSFGRDLPPSYDEINPPILADAIPKS